MIANRPHWAGYRSLLDHSLSLFLVFFLQVLNLLVIDGVYAQEETIDNTREIPVIVEAIGINADDALKKGFRNAVHQAVGVYVLSESTLINQNLETKIHANSDAIVRRYKILKQEQEGNNVKLTIGAVVIRNELAALIGTDNNPQQKVSAGWAINIANQNDSTQELLESLDTLFKNYPMCLLNVDPIGKPTKKGDALSQKIRLSLNMDAYIYFARNLSAMLEPFALRKVQSIGVPSYAITSTQDTLHYLFIFFPTNFQEIKRFRDLQFIGYQLPASILEILNKKGNKGYSIQVTAIMRDGSTKTLNNNTIDFDFFSKNITYGHFGNDSLDTHFKPHMLQFYPKAFNGREMTLEYYNNDFNTNDLADILEVKFNLIPR